MKKTSKYIKLIIIMIAICFISMAKMDGVLAIDISTDGESFIGKFEGCGNWNGCISQLGYRFRIVKDADIRDERVFFSYISAGYYNKKFTDEEKNIEWKDRWPHFEDEIKKGGNFFREILNKTLKGTDISESDFFNKNNNYAILVEPYFQISFIKGGKESYYIGTANEVAKYMIDPQHLNIHVDDYDIFPDGFDGFGSGNHLIPCTLYLPSRAGNEFCQSVDIKDHTKRREYLDAAAKDNSRYGKGLVHATDINHEKQATYTLTINKTEYDTGQVMQGVTFEICPVGDYNSDENRCTGTNIKTGTTSSLGVITFHDLKPGTYKLREYAPEGYVVAACEECSWKNATDNRLEIYIDSDKTINVSNRKACLYYFDSKKVDGNVSWKDRIDLYNKYGKTNLLNMNITTANEACQNAVGCNFTESTSCLNASVRLPYSKFNSSNLSCFKKRVGNLFCSPEFYFRSNISTTFGPIKMGQSIISFKDPESAKIGTGELRYKCYKPFGEDDIDNEEIYHLLDYASFIESDVESVHFGDVSWENGTLKWHTKIDWKPFGADLNLESKSAWNKAVSKYFNFGMYGSYDYIAKVKYYLADTIYLKYGNGQLVSETCPNCTFLGYGLISKLSNNPENLRFQIDFRSDDKFGITSLTSFCPVIYDDDRITTPKCEVVNGIYYDKNGNVVNIGEYHTSCKGKTSSKELNLEFRVIDKKNPFPGKSGTNTRVVGSNWCDNSNCSNNNNIVKKYIKDKNDSYNGTNEGPIYTITLTPNDIKNIRIYNDSTTYDDFNFIRKNKSQFLGKLKNKKLTDVNGKSIGSLSKNIFWEKDS